MKASQFHVSTLKEAPADAEIVSHKLMTRAGMIRKLAGVRQRLAAKSSVLPVSWCWPNESA